MAPPPAYPFSMPAPELLIRPRVQRAILSRALATITNDGPPDLEQISNVIIRRRALVRLPKRPIATLRYGAQLLVDIWMGMAPFSHDRQVVSTAIERLISSDRIKILKFAGCPMRGAGPAGRRDWKPWNPPPPLTPVIVLSDFGIGGPLLDRDRASLSEWLHFAKKVKDAGCQPIGFVPYEPARWPKELSLAMTLVHWSEKLTAGAVHRLRRDGRIWNPRKPSR